MATRARIKLVVSLFLLGLLFAPNPAAATVQAGVKAGDWARYVVDQHATGNVTLVQSYQNQYRTYVNVTYIDLNVTQIIGGSNVSLVQDLHRLNGSITRNQIIVDLNMAVSADNTPPVIMANMTTLTFLSTGNFSRVPRTMNNLEVDSTSGNNSSALRYSWDEITGILLSQQFVFYAAANSTNTARFTFTLAWTATNLWHYVPPAPGPSPPSSPQSQGINFAEVYAIAGVVGSMLVGIVAIARRRGPKKSRR